MSDSSKRTEKHGDDLTSFKNISLKLSPNKGTQVRKFLTSRWGGWVSRLVRKSIKMSKNLFCLFLKIVYQGSFKAP